MNNVRIESMSMGTLSILATLKSGRKMRYLINCEPRSAERQNEILSDFKNAETLKIAAEKYDAQVEIA
jgi:hypothetical protein